jgi:two-component system chemotaxis response regulator CheB
MQKKIKVLIVDDSAVVRQTLEEILSSDPDIEIMATAGDPLIAFEKMRDELPDVITLDVEMPRMDGITFLQQLMLEQPLPVVMCSSITAEGSEAALKAMELGAVDIIQKPRLGVKQFLEESRVRICDAVKAASLAKIKGRGGAAGVKPLAAKPASDYAIPPIIQHDMSVIHNMIVLVGASTGGTEALRVFLEAMPTNAPGIVIVQHMPEHFTGALARRLNDLCRINVKEAQDNDTVTSGCALIAPGNLHTMLKREGSRYYVEVKDGPLVCRHRPSVDVLFRSAARYARDNAIGIIMTGMGDDGAKGMLEMKEAGGFTLAQDEESCVVFGMPKEAINLGAVDRVLPLEHLAAAVMAKCHLASQQPRGFQGVNGEALQARF